MKDDNWVDSQNYKKHTIDIYRDDNTPDPMEWEEYAQVIIWHRSYKLGNNTDFSDSEELFDWFQNNPSVVLPVYMYSHSFITINTTGFSCPWDSGQVGWIYKTESEIKKEYKWDRMTDKRRREIEDSLRCVIDTYDKYLRGDFYGYVVPTPDDDISCWGFEDMDAAIDDAKSQIDYAIEHKRKEHIENLKTWIKIGVPIEHRKPCYV